MSRTAHKLLSASGSKGAYEIDQSLMFDRASGSYLERTLSSASNRRTWTYSGWIKRASPNSGATVMLGAHDNTNENDSGYGWIGLYTDKLYFGGGSTNWRITTRRFRDVGAWYHIVVAIDTTDGTAGDRVKIYINGEEETAFGTTNNPDQNEDLAINSALSHQIGAINYSNRNYFDGYMAEINFIDGSQLTASSFGETDSETGQWIPKEYTGSHGTNGFYMPFKKNDRYSVYFDGSTSTGIEINDSSDFDMGNGDMTCEMWFYVDEDAGTYRRLCGQSDSGGTQAQIPFSIEIDTNNKPVGYLFYSGANYETMLSSTAINDNEWNHVALVRNSGTATLYLNGTSVYSQSTSVTLNTSSGKFGVGALGEYATGEFKGWISNFRLVVGSAVYTSNFTPSTSPLTAVTNTKILCCQDATVTTDNSGTSKTLSVTAANTYSQKIAPFTFDWHQDQSGEDNHYQADNLTVNDVMLDTPTNNFATFNSLDSGSNIAVSQGNLKVTGSGWGDTHVTTKIPHTGKWYVELAVTTQGNLYFGIWTTNYTNTDAAQNYGTGKQIVHHGGITGGSSGGYISGGFSSGDIVSMAVDCDNGKIWWAKNGTWGSSGNPATGANQALTFTATDNYKIQVAGASGNVSDINFGQNGTFTGTKLAQGNADGNGVGDFYYSPPSGFKALCTKNLPTPTIKKPSEHFNTVLYTGSDDDSVSQNVTGVGFQPDLVWIKRRNLETHNVLTDALRGATKVLNSNQTVAEVDDTYGVTAFGSDGFTVREQDVAGGQTNTGTLVSWNWKANGTGGSNSDGSITCTTSANTTAGFSMVYHATDGYYGGTYGHGLGKTPAFMIVRDVDNVNQWYVWHQSYGNQTHDYGLFNDDAAITTGGSASWGSPSSTTIQLDQGLTRKGISYVWAEIEGFSKFGSYKGNGSADGPFINCGFRPAFVIFRPIANGNYWLIIDNKRDPFNDDAPQRLYSNVADAETTYSQTKVDFLSNGFKINGTYGDTNVSGGTILYMAWAESPFKYANAR